MSVKLHTDDPRALLDEIKSKIDTDKIRTWAYDDDGDFTHTAEQWKNEAWLQPSIEDGYLLLTIIHPKNKSISSEVYAVYHGRFIEMALRHCDTLFTRAIASSMPANGDKIKA